MTIKAPVNCPSKYNSFTHLDPNHYMNYFQGILHQKGGGFDVDVQLSANGTPQALHWGTVGRNNLHDPSGKIKASAAIASLTDAQLKTLRGPAGRDGSHASRSACSMLAAKQGVRVELELKVLVPAATLQEAHGFGSAGKALTAQRQGFSSRRWPRFLLRQLVLAQCTRRRRDHESCHSRVTPVPGSSRPTPSRSPTTPVAHPSGASLR